MSYFKERINDELGLQPKQYTIQLYNSENQIRDVEIFSEDEKGNIRILVYTLDRKMIEVDNPKANPERPVIENNRTKTFYITRLKEPVIYKDKEGNEQTKKYDIPKGAGTYPFITPGLIEKFENKTPIKTLVLTEGYFKAFKGSVHGLDIVGLSSITHYKDKDSGRMYEDIIRIIKECKVENVIMLYDGDCRNISHNAIEKGKDLYTRPATFLASASRIRELLIDYGINIYFASINSECLESAPKGLDDLLIRIKDKEFDATNELVSFSIPGFYFIKFDITRTVNKLVKFLNIQTVDTFYDAHSDLIKSREFVYRGTKYVRNFDKTECEVIIPGEAKSYFRVGDQYYKFVKIPNKYNQLDRTFKSRQKTTIIDDHGKNFVNHIPKYEAFCNVPDHTNYQQVINNCFNIYQPFSHEPDEGNCDNILNFVKHIFRDQYDFGLDYIQLLYQRPTQVLPILCLVSKENQTGKSTFIKLLKAIFSSNAIIVGNEDFANSFNAHWVSKILICCEESFIEKKVIVEKIKSLATGDTIAMNAKNKDQQEVDFFGKFVLASNNETNFIYANREDIRYWVVKVNQINKEQRQVNLLNVMIDEIPAFLNFLNQRKITTANESRMWFNEDLIFTDALKKLIDSSRHPLEREIEYYFREMFFEFGVQRIIFDMRFLKENILKNKHSEIFAKDIIENNLHIPRANDGKVTRTLIPYWSDTIIDFTKRPARCYEVEISDFLTPDEVEKVKNSNNNLLLGNPEELPF